MILCCMFMSFLSCFFNGIWSHNWMVLRDLITARIANTNRLLVKCFSKTCHVLGGLLTLIAFALKIFVARLTHECSGRDMPRSHQGGLHAGAKIITLRDIEPLRIQTGQCVVRSRTTANCCLPPVILLHNLISLWLMRPSFLVL